MIASAARRRLPRRVAQMLGQLRPERRLDHPARQLRQNTARSGDLLRLKALQRLLELVRGQQAHETINDVVGRHGRLLAVAVDAWLGLHSLRIRVLSRPRPGSGSPLRPTGSASTPTRQHKPNQLPQPHTEHRTDPGGRVVCTRYSDGRSRGAAMLNPPKEHAQPRNRRTHLDAQQQRPPLPGPFPTRPRPSTRPAQPPVLAQAHQETAP